MSVEIQTINNYLDEASALMAKSKSLAHLIDLAADLQIPDTSAFQNLTGWKPEISFEKTLSDLLNYWRNKISSLGSAIQR